MNKKQERFVDEYMVDANATRAARAAGYSERSARNQGNRLMKNDDISHAIEERAEELKQLCGATAENKRDMLWRIAQFNQQLVNGMDGQPEMRNPRAAIQALAELNRMDGDYRKADAGGVTEVTFIQHFGPDPDESLDE